MSHTGLGVMIGMLGGNKETVDAYHASVGKTISKLTLYEEDGLIIEFNDATYLCVSDEGQSCCEHRYMRTDDDIQHFIGAKLTGLEIKEAPEEEADEWGTHEVQFLEVQTDRGVFTMASHNEHNGQYSGFDITLRVGRSVT